MESAILRCFVPIGLKWFELIVQNAETTFIRSVLLIYWFDVNLFISRQHIRHVNDVEPVCIYVCGRRTSLVSANYEIP